MKSEPFHIPVIMHTNNLVSNLNVLSMDCDSGYGSRSDSENGDMQLDILDLRAIASKALTVRPIECKWSACGKTFDFLDDLAAHVTSLHANSGPGGLFFCGWEGCNRSNRGFNARYKMLVHVRTHTNEKPHRCFQCDKSFSRAENLKIHSRSHTGEKPYVCPVAGCSKAYSNSSDRFKHTRTHSVDKPYVCKVPNCGKRYTDPSSLRKHVKTYRHFSKELGTEDITTVEVNDVIKVQEKFYHEEIVPENETNLKSLQKNYSESCNNGCYYNLVRNKEGGFEFFKDWFNNEHMNWYQEETEAYWNACYYYEMQEQEMPLDLTLHK